MTTVLSQKGQVVLPAPLRKALGLLPGDDLEVGIEDDDTIVLRRISRPANHGLAALLRACPAPFAVPAREHDDSEAPVL